MIWNDCDTYVKLCIYIGVQVWTMVQFGMVVGNGLLSNEMKGKKKGVDIPFVISLQLGLKKNGVIVSFGDNQQAILITMVDCAVCF